MVPLGGSEWLAACVGYSVMGSGGVRPSGTVTFLFTDIEGSTARWEADEDAMRSALAEHDDVLREANRRRDTTDKPDSPFTALESSAATHRGRTTNRRPTVERATCSGHPGTGT